MTITEAYDLLGRRLGYQKPWAVEFELANDRDGNVSVAWRVWDGKIHHESGTLDAAVNSAIGSKPTGSNADSELSMVSVGSLEDGR